MTTRRPRTEILAAVLLAFSTGCVDGAGLTVAEWDWAETEIETAYAGDFDKVAAALRDEMAACALACRVTEKG
jgi:hypothetical protein